jgi:hypothetical protein
MFDKVIKITDEIKKNNTHGQISKLADKTLKNGLVLQQITEHCST